MGLANRWRRRKCARYILATLHKKAPDHDLFLTREDWYDPNIPALTMEELEKRTKKYSLGDLKRTTRLLTENEHITLTNCGNPLHPNNKAILCMTPKGRDAFLDGYYKRENKKDLLEEIELNSKIIKGLIIFNPFKR